MLNQKLYQTSKVEDDDAEEFLLKKGAVFSGGTSGLKGQVTKHHLLQMLSS